MPAEIITDRNLTASGSTLNQSGPPHTATAMEHRSFRLSNSVSCFVLWDSRHLQSHFFFPMPCASQTLQNH